LFSPSCRRHFIYSNTFSITIFYSEGSPTFHIDSTHIYIFLCCIYALKFSSISKSINIFFIFLCEYKKLYYASHAIWIIFSYTYANRNNSRHDVCFGEHTLQHTHSHIFSMDSFMNPLPYTHTHTRTKFLLHCKNWQLLHSIENYAYWTVKKVYGHTHTPCIFFSYIFIMYFVHSNAWYENIVHIYMHSFIYQ
jgi:hypothetical protein